MDLSVGGNLKKMRGQILKYSPIPVGTVPIYEIAVNAKKDKGNFLKFSVGDALAVLESQAQEGIDFFTIHSGVTKTNELPLISSTIHLPSSYLANATTTPNKESVKT